jgi:tetratricopeptide (TPR) repeat protein
LLEECLALVQATGETRLVVVTLSHLGRALRQLGEDARAEALYEESVDLARQQADRWALALALNNRGSDLADSRVDLDRARSMLEESLSLRRQLQEKRGIAVTLDSLGTLALLEGAPARATTLYTESLTLARDVGLVPHTAWALAGLGLAAVQDHNGERAVPLLMEGLELAQRLHDAETVLLCIAGLASVAADRGQPVRAVHLWGAAERLRSALNGVSSLGSVIGETWLDATRQQLGDPAFEDALTTGARLSLDELVIEAAAILQ